MASPTRLDYARELAAKGEQPETHAAQLEIAVITARTTADLATISVPHGKLGRPVQFGKFFCASHRIFLNA
jgi:hypothetical protein